MKLSLLILSCLFSAYLSAQSVHALTGRWESKKHDKILMLLGGTQGRPTILQYSDCYGKPCTGLSSYEPKEYYPVKSGWRHVRDAHCEISYAPGPGWSPGDPLTKVAKVTFWSGTIYPNSNSLLIYHQYCTNGFQPATCPTNPYSLVWENLERFSCTGGSDEYRRIGPLLSYAELVGEWSAPSGILKTETGEIIAKGVRLKFANTKNQFSLDYEICHKAEDCVPGKDVFAHIEGRLIGQNLLVKCEKENGTVIEKNVGELMDNSVEIILPDRVGHCPSVNPSRLKIIQNNFEKQLTILGNEGTLEGRAIVYKTPEEQP